MVFSQALHHEGMNFSLAEDRIQQVTEQMHALLGEAYHSVFFYLSASTLQ